MTRVLAGVCVGAFVAAIVGDHPVVASAADATTSRIYVVAYPCAPTASGPVVAPGDPTVDVYDQALYGDSGNPVAIRLPVTVTKATAETVEFYFDLRPGNYDAYIKFPTTTPKAVCGRNGPLVALPGKNRHLFVAAMTGITDWHAPGAVAGTLPMSGVGVSILLYDHPMRCGDDVRSHDPKTFRTTVFPQVGNSVLDDGAFYQNIHAFGKQDHTVALEFWGGLFTHGTVLLTVVPDTKPGKPPFIEKDVSTEILRAATANQFVEKLVCIPGF